MATRARWTGAEELPVIESYTTILEKSKKTSGKLFVILCNVEYPDSNSIEEKFNTWRSQYETTYDVRVFKCVIGKKDKNQKEKFNIKKTPTFVFIRDGNELGRIEDLEESNPLVKDETKPGEESNDEKRVKARLDELCKKT